MPYHIYTKRSLDIDFSEYEDLDPELIAPQVEVPRLVLWEGAAAVGGRVRRCGAMARHIVFDKLEICPLRLFS